MALAPPLSGFLPASSSRTASPALASAERCAVCGSAELRIDEVFERGLWRLGECRRCRHRWTEGPLGPPPVAAARRVCSQSAAA